MSLVNTLSGRSQIEEQLNSFTYDKSAIDQKIADANKPLNEIQQTKPLTGNLVFGTDYFVQTQKVPLQDFDVVNKLYADNLAVDAGAIKNQIRANNSSVVCTNANVNLSINSTSKISVDSDSVDLSQKAQYVGNVSVSGDSMLVPKIYVDVRDNAVIGQIDDLATELRGVDTTLQQLIETDSARISQLNGDYQNFKTVTVPTTYMKKTADSNLDLVNTYRIKNVPGTVAAQDAISRGETDQRYMAKTTTLDAIPLPVADLNLNGVKVRGSGTITIGDIGGVGTGDTLATLQWVESRGGVYRNQAQEYSDGRLQSAQTQLNLQITAVDAKKPNYTQGIDVMGIPLLDYNMGRTALFNLRDGVQDRDSVNMQQLNAVALGSTTGLNLKADKTYVDTQLATKYDYSNGIANSVAISNLQNDKANKTDVYTKTEADTLLATKANVLTTYSKTQVDNALSLKLDLAGGTMSGALNTGGNRIIQSYTPQVNYDVVNKESLDAGLLLKANQTDLTTLSNNLTANYYTKTVIDSSLNTKADKTTVTALQSDVSTLSGNLTTTNNNLSANYNTKTQDTALFKPIAQIETKIQNAAANSKIECTGDNSIAIRSNGQDLGSIYAPTGQSTANQFGILANDKISMQSAVSSVSLYGGKTPVVAKPGINTHQMVMGGRDDANLNVQQNLNLTQGTAQANLSAGHFDLGSGQVNFASLSADSALLLSGGTPQVDPQLQMYSTAKATAIGTSLPIQATGKMGYASTTTVDQVNQFTSKAYVDAQDATKLSLSGGTLTGALTLSVAPTTNLMAATKAYVDSQVAGAGTGDFKANGTVAMTGNLNMGTTNKIINLADPTLAQDGSTKAYTDTQVATKISQTQGDARYYLNTVALNAITAPSADVSLNSKKITNLLTPSANTDATHKLYVDTADALKVSKSGDTMTGALVLYGDPTANLQASTKQYTDTQVATKISQTQGDARYLQLTGGTLTGALTLPSNPSSNLQAATKQYVDSAVAGVGSSISTSGGYSVVTSANDVQIKNGSTALQKISNFTTSQFVELNGNNYSQYFPDNSSVSYFHHQYSIINTTARPRLQIIDIGTEGTQTIRLSAWNNTAGGYANETYLQFKPLLSSIQTSVPISMITEPTYTGLNLVSKNYVDGAIAGASSAVQNKIQTTVDDNNRMTVQCNTGQVSISKKNIVDQIQFTGNSITQVSGTGLAIQRGSVQVLLTDDGTTQNIGFNFPAIYSSSPTTATTDQLVSQRITDSRYIKLDGTSTISANLPLNSKKITGLANATVSGDAIHYGQFQALMRSFGIRRSNCFSFYAGDLPLGNNVTITNVSGDSILNVSGVVHFVASAANYFRCTVVHNFGHDGIKLFGQTYGTRTDPNLYTRDNDNGLPVWIENIVYEVAGSQIRFDVVYEPNLGDTQAQQNGYNILLQEQL